MASNEDQKAHAERIKIEGEVQRSLGVTREQARQVLAREAVTLREAAQRKPVDVTSTPAPQKPPPATVTTDSVAFEPRPLTLNADPGGPGSQSRSDGGGSSGGGGRGTPINDVYIMVNGTRYLTDILTDGRLDPA